MLTKSSILDQLDDVTAKTESLEAQVSALTDTLDSVQYVLACLCRAKGLEPTGSINQSVDSEYISELISEYGEDGLIELMA